MGYTTYFEGIFSLDQRLWDSQVLYLLAFANTRRVKRDVTVLQNAPDPARVAVGLPLGKDGGYFVNQQWDEDHDQISVVDYNQPPSDQPGLWCQWIPTSDGSGIQWNGGEKFYHYIAWLQYLILHFLEPWGYQLQGEVKWQGEDPTDQGVIRVENNQLVLPAGIDFLKEATAPIAVPHLVMQGLEAIQAVNKTALYSWLAAEQTALELGYPETAQWIQSHLELYIRGIKQGFVGDDKT